MKDGLPPGGLHGPEQCIKKCFSLEFHWKIAIILNTRLFKMRHFNDKKTLASLNGGTGADADADPATGHDSLEASNDSESFLALDSSNPAKERAAAAMELKSAYRHKMGNNSFLESHTRWV